MKVILFIVSLVWIFYGGALFILTDKTREYSEKYFLTEKIKKIAFIPLAIGLILLVGSFFSNLFWLSFIIGLLATIKGTYLLVAPIEQVNTIQLYWYREADKDSMMLYGLFVYLLGAALFGYLM